MKEPDRLPQDDELMKEWRRMKRNDRRDRRRRAKSEQILGREHALLAQAVLDKRRAAKKAAKEATGLTKDALAEDQSAVVGGEGESAVAGGGSVVTSNVSSSSSAVVGNVGVLLVTS